MDAARLWPVDKWPSGTWAGCCGVRSIPSNASASSSQALRGPLKRGAAGASLMVIGVVRTNATGKDRCVAQAAGS